MVKYISCVYPPDKLLYDVVIKWIFFVFSPFFAPYFAMNRNRAFAGRRVDDDDDNGDDEDDGDNEDNDVDNDDGVF